MLNIIIVGLVVLIVLDLFAFLTLWGCFEDQVNRDLQNEKGGVE